jgi:Spy/CpxP family protein refolding chaperone
MWNKNINISVRYTVCCRFYSFWHSLCNYLGQNVKPHHSQMEDIVKKNMLIKGIVIATVVFILGYGVNAVAGWGRGPGSGGCGGPGGRWGGDTSLTAEQYKQLDEQRQSFFESTATLRQNIYQKDLDLRGELSKETPDTELARRLQKELSQMEAELEQKRFDHMIAMREINPNAGRGGYGRGGYGRGARGPGYSPCQGGGGGGQRCW